MVALLGARCLHTAALVSPGQEVKNPQSMDLIHVDFAELKAVACRKFINSRMVLVS